jgi:diaminohydroxyphosphoribosylaminopyrimidine deaminase / 5-amino-6-(5-phosphoribosylamino)uracil reductase
MVRTRVARDADAFMRRALDLARKGWGQTAPNPMVGAVVVRDSTIVGEGWHERYGGAHAEINALAAAGDRARGATLYVTLEPCRHHGKTPPCTDAIVAAGIQRVYVGALDPSRDAGGGASVLRTAGIDVQSGVLEDAARELNAPFFHALASDLPWTTLKIAVSMDMAISDARGTTTWLTGEESRAEVHRLRAGHDAVAVGVGTILADDPQLTVRGAVSPRVPPARVVFDRSLRTPLASKVVKTARETPTIIVTTDDRSERARILRDAGVRLVVAPDLRGGFRELRSAGIRALMVEGGARINSAVLAEKLVHRLITFQAPVALGPKALHAFDGASSEVLAMLERVPPIERRRFGPDVMTTYALAEI